MRYFIYARRSSEDKAKQIQSIPNQLEWAERKRAERDMDIIDTFTDTKTGTKPGRDGFNAMMEAIEANPEPVGILCWKVNRLARNPIDEGAIKYAFMRGKIKHILASDRQFNEGESQILMGVEFGSATQFSIDLSHDVRRGISRKVERGWKPGVAPLGYLNDPAGLKGEKRIFRDPTTWGKVRQLWDMVLENTHSLPWITRIANDDLGLRTRRGGRLSPSTLHRLLHNSFYAGFFNWCGQHVKGKHEAMVSLAEFERVGRILSGNRQRPQKRQSRWNGMIRCGECGCMITTEPPKVKVLKNGNRLTYNYLRCSKRSREVRCGQPFLRQSQLETQIEELLASIQIPEDFIAWAAQKAKGEKSEAAKARNHRRGQLKQQLGQVGADLVTLTGKLVNGVISDQTFQASQHEYEQE